MAEDIVDCVSHVVDVCLRVDFFAVSMHDNGSLSLFGGSANFLFPLVSLPCNFGPGSRVYWLLRWGVRVGRALWLSLSWGLFLCALRVHRLGVGIGSRGGGGVLRWFALGSAHPLDLLFKAGLSLLEVVVLVFDRGGHSDERCDQVF